MEQPATPASGTTPWPCRQCAVGLHCERCLTAVGGSKIRCQEGCLLRGRRLKVSPRLFRNLKLLRLGDVVMWEGGGRTCEARCESAAGA